MNFKSKLAIFAAVTALALSCSAFADSDGGNATATASHNGNTTGVTGNVTGNSGTIQGGAGGAGGAGGNATGITGGSFGGNATGINVGGFGNKVLSPEANANSLNLNTNTNSNKQQQGQIQGQSQSADNNGNNWNYTNVQPDHLKTTGVAPSIQGNTTAPCRIQIGASAGWMGGSFGAGSSILDEGCDTGRDIEIIKAMPGLSDAERNLAAVSRACDKPTLAKALGNKCLKPEAEVKKTSAIRSNTGVVTSKQY